MSPVSQVLPSLFFGASLGLSAGIIPGPLVSVIVAQTLKHCFKEGLKIIFSIPLVDIVRVPVTLLLLSSIAIEGSITMGWLYLIGAAYLFKLGYENFFYTGDFKLNKDAKPQSFVKGAAVLLLNPGSHLFWFALAGPAIITGYAVSIWLPIAFLAGFYFAFMGINFVYLALTSKAGWFFKSNIYKYTLKALGLTLVGFAILYMKNALAVIL